MSVAGGGDHIANKIVYIPGSIHVRFLAIGRDVSATAAACQSAWFVCARRLISSLLP